MSVAFPTNQVGSYTFYASKADKKYATWWGGKHSQTDTYPFSHRDSTSIKQAIRHGDRIRPTPYYRFAARVVSDQPSVIQLKGADQYGAWSDTRHEHMSRFLSAFIVTDPPGLPGIVSNSRAKALTEALNKLREGKINNGANLGQAKTTANMIADRLKSVLYAYRAAKYGNFLLSLKHLGISPRGTLSGLDPARFWLEYQYGWKPLLSDIHDNYESLRDQMGKESLAFSVKRNVRQSHDVEIDTGTGYIDRYECVVRSQVGFRASPWNSLLANFDQYGLLNPLEVVWELIPFSFVVDWFVPVGNVLESLSATAGLDFVSGYRSTTVLVKKTSRRSAAPSGGWVLQESGKLEVHGFTFEREVFSQWPLPEFYADTTPISSPRASNAVALLRSILR